MNELASHPEFGVVGSTIRVQSGGYFDIADPSPIMFTLGDVACGVSKICRFGAQIKAFYSVAEHLYWCSVVAANRDHSADCQLAVLLHDAAEAFIGDMVRPLKHLLPGFKIIERRIERVIEQKFEVDFEKHKSVISEIDNSMLIAERDQLWEPDGVEWAGEKLAFAIDFPIERWGHLRAAAMFESQVNNLLYLRKAGRDGNFGETRNRISGKAGHA